MKSSRQHQSVSVDDSLKCSLASPADGSFDFVIKRQRRKTIALHIMPDATVEVRVPKWVPKYEIVDFVEQRWDWVIDQRKEALKKLALKPSYCHGQYHYFLGQRYPLHVSASGRVSVSFGDDGWRVEVRNVDNSEQIQKALEQWYRRQAVEYYEERMFVCFERFPNWFQDKYRVPNITIRKMRRCWGSCARNGGVTLNLSLIKMPVQCVDYVITHELCHVEAFHHGKAFYHLLASVMPTWREREALIEQLGIHTV